MSNKHESLRRLKDGAKWKSYLLAEAFEAKSSMTDGELALAIEVLKESAGIVRKEDR